MKNNLGLLICFVSSSLALLISIILLYNMGHYVDEYGTSPSVVYGGDFWLYMAWLRLALLSLTTAISGIKLFRK